VIGDVHDAGMGAVQSEIEALGGSAAWRHTDVSRSEQLRALVEFSLEARPSLDVVVANAGLLDPAPLGELSDERFAQTVDMNLIHPFALARECAAALRESRGSVILMSSTGGMRGIVGQSAYSATKAALINLTRVLSAELGPQARANCVCPGWVDTPFNDSIWELLGGRAAREGELLARVPLRRQGRPEEIAAAVTFLASEDASYITGQALVVDGGMTAV
jgi:NAD(P)-dependent dehydrogenase (short-subunit alcohol dehydrogenase family)